MFRFIAFGFVIFLFHSSVFSNSTNFSQGAQKKVQDGAHSSEPTSKPTAKSDKSDTTLPSDLPSDPPSTDTLSKTTTTPETSSEAPTMAANIAAKNLEEGQQFLKENLKQPGVKTLPSGLQYKIIKEGAGTPPGPTDFVSVNYRGMLLDKKEFDSSYAHHAPAVFAVNAVIPGWSEALQQMKPGAHWTIYVPAHLAYGKEGAGHIIGPNMVLIFDIELISVKSSLEENSNEPNEELEG